MYVEIENKIEFSSFTSGTTSQKRVRLFVVTTSQYWRNWGDVWAEELHQKGSQRSTGSWRRAINGRIITNGTSPSSDVGYLSSIMLGINFFKCRKDVEGRKVGC